MLLEHSIHVCMYMLILLTHVASNTSLALNLSQVYTLGWYYWRVQNLAFLKIHAFSKY